MTMLAHTVKVFDGSESAAPPPAAEAPKEEWKEEAFAEMNKNVAAHDVVAPPEAKKTYKIVMIRHGESEWNKENRFCGWFDSDLSEKGNLIIISYSLRAY